MRGNTIKKHPSKQNIKVAVDNCIFTIRHNALHMVLIQMKKKPFQNQWAVPGGLVKNGESLDHAAKRVLFEETGLCDVYLEQLYTFGDPKRDVLGHVISTAYFALIPSGDIKLKTHKKYLDVQWTPVKNIRKLAYDHNKIVEYAKKRLAWKIEYTNVVWSLLSPTFTLTELQGVYETVLERELDKRNFRKKVFSLQLIEKTGQSKMGGAHRPAMLYRFKSTKPMIVDM